jgi:hypothetical protein
VLMHIGRVFYLISEKVSTEKMEKK